MNWYHYGFRVYDAALGRFPSIDPASDKFPHVSTYNYAENEPVGSIDLWGLQRWKVNGRERTEARSEFAKNLTRGGFALAHDKPAKDIIKGPKSSSKTASRIGRKLSDNGDNLTQGLGNEENAVRHTLWSAMITATWGEDIAEKATNAHEGIGILATSEIDFTEDFKGDKNLADTIVDLLNNEEGRNIGNESSTKNPLELAKSVLKSFKNNGLWVFKMKEGKIVIEKTKIDQKQYDNLLKILEKIDTQKKLKKMKNSFKFYLIILIATIIFTSCSSNEKCADLFTRIKSNYVNKIDNIDLKKVFNFDWDTLYVIEEYISSKSIKKNINVDCECDSVPDSQELYLFVKNNKVIEKSLGECKGYNFSLPYLKGGGIIKIDAKNSRFTIQKKESYYVLVPYSKTKN